METNSCECRKNWHWLLIIFVAVGIVYFVVKSLIDSPNENTEISENETAISNELSPDDILMESEQNDQNNTEKREPQSLKKRQLTALPQMAVNEILEVIDVSYHKSEQDQICFQLNHHASPNLHALDNNRVYFNLRNVKSWHGLPQLPKDFRFVKNVRSYLHKDQNTLKIVFDLHADKKFRYKKTINREKPQYCVSFYANEKSTL